MNSLHDSLHDFLSWFFVMTLYQSQTIFMFFLYVSCYVFLHVFLYVFLYVSLYVSLHHIKECVMSLNKRRCINCNKDHELWRCICLKWRQQMKQTSEIYRNRLIRYLKTSKYNRAFFSLFLNSLSLMNLLSSTDFIDSTNSSSSTSIMLKTRNRDVESTWQMIEVKKRRVNLFSCVTSDTDETASEQTQKRSIRKCERFSVIESIQRVFSAQSQQQLQITLW